MEGKRRRPSQAWLESNSINTQIKCVAGREDDGG